MSPATATRSHARSHTRIAMVYQGHPARGEAVLTGAALLPRPPGVFLRPFHLAGGRQAHRSVLRWRPDGIVVSAEPRVVDALYAACPQLVSIYAEEPDPRMPQIVVDEAAVGALAAEHLLDRGLRHFAAVVQGTGGGARLDGWAAGLAQRGAGGATLRLRGRGDEARRLAEWLAAQPRPLGVLAYNDVIASDVIEACHRAGLAIPHEVAIVAADDHAAYCHSPEPALSSVQVPHQAVGRVALTTLLAVLAGRRHARRRSVPPSGLNVRPSSDTSAYDDPIVAGAMAAIQREAPRIRDVDALARRLRVSRRVLERHLRSVLGCSPHQALQQRRMELAKHLLREGLTTRAVAERVGLPALGSFHRAFRSHTGTSPVAWQRFHG